MEKELEITDKEKERLIGYIKENEIKRSTHTSGRYIYRVGALFSSGGVFRINGVGVGGKSSDELAAFIVDEFNKDYACDRERKVRTFLDGLDRRKHFLSIIDPFAFLKALGGFLFLAGLIAVVLAQ